MIGPVIVYLSFIPILAIVQDHPPARPEGWPPGYGQGREERIRQQKEDIKRAQQQALANSNSARAHFDLGEAYRRSGGTGVEPAAEAYNRAIHLKPDYSEAYKGLAWAYGVLRNYKKQIEALRQAIAFSPNDAEAYCKLGEALNTFDIGRKVPPYPSSEELKLAREAHREKAGLAVEAYEQAIRLKPGYAEAYSGLGSAYLYLQRHSEAIEAYKRAIEYEPNNPLIRIGLGYVYLSQKNHKAALEQHKEAMQLGKEARNWSLRVACEIAAQMLLARIQESIEEMKQR